MEPRYAMIARRLAQDLSRGLWSSGERMPSIRALAQTHGVSLNTIKEAYVRLELQGLVEARPRSGYFAGGRQVPRKETSPDALAPQSAGVSGLWLEVHRWANQGAPFGLLGPSPDLDSRRLDRLLGRQSRSPGPGLPPQGDPDLRRQVARYLGDLGCPVDPQRLFITSGAMDAVFLALTILTKSGDRIIVESPFFSSALQLWETLGLELVELPASPIHGPDPDALARAIDQWNPAAVVLCPSFANPLGSLVPEENRPRLVEICRRRGVPLVEDDVFGDLAFDVPRPRPLKAWDTDGTVVLAGSFSKTSAPGWRVGWLEAGRWSEEAERLAWALGPRTAAPVQRALAEHLGRGDYRRFLAKVRPNYSRSRDRLVEALARSWPPGTDPVIPAGGLSLWCRLPPGLDALVLTNRARSLGHGLMPGPVFTLGNGHTEALRLTFSTWDETVVRAIEDVGSLGRALLDAG